MPCDMLRSATQTGFRQCIKKAKKLQIFFRTSFSSPPPEDLLNNTSSRAQEHYVQSLPLICVHCSAGHTGFITRHPLN